MPLYEYICRGCRTDFEALIPAARRDDGAVCPQCGGVKVARKISLSAAPVIRGGDGGSPEPLTCGAPSCCGGGCAVDN